jgi:hypothetical protein
MNKMIFEAPRFRDSESYAPVTLTPQEIFMVLILLEDEWIQGP